MWFPLNLPSTAVCLCVYVPEAPREEEGLSLRVRGHAAAQTLLSAGSGRSCPGGPLPVPCLSLFTPPTRLWTVCSWGVFLFIHFFCRLS